jgi:Flp pilus assembly secretin CpaC
MPGFVRSALFAAGVFAASAVGAGQAVLAQDADSVLVTVNTNMARVLRIDSPAATVIIGNPAIADVTIQDPQTLVLTGKSFGRTNMIILDGNGDPIADTIVEVAQVPSDSVTIFMGDRRTSVACAPNCAPTISLGDDLNYTVGTIENSRVISDAAQ